MKGKRVVGSLLFLLPVLSAGLPVMADGGYSGSLHAFWHKRDDGPKNLLKDKEKEIAATLLDGLDQEVRIVLFSTAAECKKCEEAERLMGEISALSPRVNLEILSLETDHVRAGELGIDKVPAIALLGKEDPGIRYYGTPLGYEFKTFVRALRQVAERDTDLEPETLSRLALLEGPVTVTVFVSQH